MTSPYTELQEKWLTDLETTQEAQGRGDLMKPIEDGKFAYCCLGRAAILIGEPVMQWDKCEFEGHFSSLPLDYTEKLGLKDGFGRFDFDGSDYDSGKYTDLTQLNDSAKWSFKQIAAFIRANPEKVFNNLDKE